MTRLQEGGNLTRISELGKTLAYESSLEARLQATARTARDIIGAERCSVFIQDRCSGMLWTVHADVAEHIAVPRDRGIVGMTLKSAEPQIENAPADSPAFYDVIDYETGFQTRSIAAVPIFGYDRRVIGVMELLNKCDGIFTDDDIDVMKFIANFAGGFLEIVLYEAPKC